MKAIAIKNLLLQVQLQFQMRWEIDDELLSPSRNWNAFH
jgi:hypothetical protein